MFIVMQVARRAGRRRARASFLFPGVPAADLVVPHDRHGAHVTDRDARPGVLFLCVHNAGRSQMALGWFHHLAGDRAVAWSAGSEPADEVNPAAVAAMAEVGIDIAARAPEAVDRRDRSRAADVVVTMGCGDACPVVPGQALRGLGARRPGRPGRRRRAADPRRDRAARPRPPGTPRGDRKLTTRRVQGCTDARRAAGSVLGRPRTVRRRPRTHHHRLPAVRAPAADGAAHRSGRREGQHHHHRVGDRHQRERHAVQRRRAALEPGDAGGVRAARAAQLGHGGVPEVQDPPRARRRAAARVQPVLLRPLLADHARRATSS